MASDTSRVSLTLADVERWRERGIITQDQAEAIRQDTAERPAPQRTGRFGMVSIAYYFGAFMVLLAYTIFLAYQWNEMSAWVRAAMMGATVVILWAAGGLLHRGGLTTPGGLLVFVGVGFVPLTVGTMLDAAGLWPDTLSRAEQFPRLAAMLGSGLAAALGAVWLTRFPLIVTLAALWGWLLLAEVVSQVTGRDWYWMGVEVQVAGSLLGVALLGVGVGLQGRTAKDYSFWLYLSGHILTLGHLGSLAFTNEGVYALIFPLLYVGFVVASVWLRRRVFLVFGALGVYGYLCYLAFDVFSGMVGFSAALASVGLLMVLGGVVYQRFVRPALAT